MIETGCVIDCSHFSAYALNFEIIKYAEMNGWDGGANDTDKLVNDWHEYIHREVPSDWEGDPEDFQNDYREALDYAADDAVDWLNDNTAHDGYYYTVDDNSLYYWKVDDEDV